MARFGLVLAMLLLLGLGAADLALAQAGGGSGGFGGGGGGGGGVGGGGGGTGTASPWVVAVFFGIFGLVILFLAIHAARYRRKLRKREERVRTASAEAAEDDAYFAAHAVELDAAKLFIQAQVAWDARDRGRLAQLVGEDLLVEWNRRLDDFDRKGWHNRVEVVNAPKVRYVGITNREDDTEDRVVVRIEAMLKAYVIDKTGKKILRTGAKSEQILLTEYWTLGRRDGSWIVASIEQRAEGDHQLDEEIVASPWSAARVRDEAVTELAVADKLPEGFTTADLAEVDFAGDARARALDLALADARFAPAVLEAAARRAVEAWAEAVDGEDAPLEAIASPEAVRELLYAGDASQRTRLVVRGPRVKRIRIASVEVEREPATMTIEVEVGGRRYVENRDTTTVVSGDKDTATIFTERWTLALDGPEDAPWRLVAAR